MKKKTLCDHMIDEKVPVLSLLKSAMKEGIKVWIAINNSGFWQSSWKICQFLDNTECALLWVWMPYFTQVLQGGETYCAPHYLKMFGKFCCIPYAFKSSWMQSHIVPCFKYLCGIFLIIGDLEKSSLVSTGGKGQIGADLRGNGKKWGGNR